MVACRFGNSQIVHLGESDDDDVDSNLFMGLECVIMQNLS